jgi:hypothetical protein
MKSLPLNSELEFVARRVVWFEDPERALADPIRFAAYVLTYGMHGDVEVLRRYIGDEGLKEAVLNAPSGIFDGRSWAYWNLKNRPPSDTANAGAQLFFAIRYGGIIVFCGHLVPSKETGVFAGDACVHNGLGTGNALAPCL